MARFHFDQNVSSRIADDLRGRGHDVMTAWELGLMGADDDVHLTAAAADRRILVTHNGDDFLLLHKAWIRWPSRWTAIIEQRLGAMVSIPEYHAGVLIVPQAPHSSPETVATEIDLFVNSSGALTNCCFVYDWQSGPGWLQDMTGLV